MGKNTQQGTRWESHLVTQGKSFGMAADRLPKRSVEGEPDLWLNLHPEATKLHMPVVAWKRLVRKSPGNKRRSPMGIGRVVILREEDFFELAHVAAKHRDYSFLVQAKATERLSVTTVLHSVVKAVKEIWK